VGLIALGRGGSDLLHDLGGRSLLWYVLEKLNS